MLTLRYRHDTGLLEQAMRSDYDAPGVGSVLGESFAGYGAEN